MAYLLWLEQLERHTNTAVLLAGMARAAGHDAPVPDWDQVHRDFDAWLAEEPDELKDDDQAVLLQALGLR